MMKKQLLTILVLVAIAFSCSKDEAVAPDDEAVYKKGVTEKIITFKQSSGTIEVIPCEVCETGYQLRTPGSGIATHLGNFTVLNEVCIDIISFDPFEFVQEGDWLGYITAANGDELHTKMINGPYFPEGLEGPAYYDYIVLGGTGRFADVTGGDWVIYGTADLVNMTWELKGGGPIYFE
jgi:hypothetical protein